MLWQPSAWNHNYPVVDGNGELTTVSAKPEHSKKHDTFMPLQVLTVGPASGVYVAQVSEQRQHLCLHSPRHEFPCPPT